jgi:hypothetical protein
MSNYTQSTNFATKDALPSGDPLKIVKGTEINTEFVNISTAIATKADLTSGAVAASSGGTGATTLTANNVILGNGTSAVQFVAPGTTGNVLTSNGTTWSSTAPSAALTAANAVGAYALMYSPFSTIALGGPVAGVSIRFAGGIDSSDLWAESATGTAGAGTWRLMGGAGPNGQTDSTYPYGLFLRIA